MTSAASRSHQVSPPETATGASPEGNHGPRGAAALAPNGGMTARAYASALAFAASMWAGVYLCMHDFPVLGGWVCILTLFANWGFEHEKKS